MFVFNKLTASFGMFGSRTPWARRAATEADARQQWKFAQHELPRPEQRDIDAHRCSYPVLINYVFMSGSLSSLLNGAA